jgi:hypothetical protein
VLISQDAGALLKSFTEVRLGLSRPALDFQQVAHGDHGGERVRMLFAQHAAACVERRVLEWHGRVAQTETFVTRR